MPEVTLYRLNDNLIELTGLTNGVTGAIISNATVGVTLTKSDGAPVAGDDGLEWPVAMAATGTPGSYRAILEDGLVLTAGEVLIADVDVDAGGDLKAHWTLDVRVQDRN